MPDLIPTLKKIFFLKKSNNTHNSLIYLNSQNNKFRWCMGIACVNVLKSLARKNVSRVDGKEDDLDLDFEMN